MSNRSAALLPLTRDHHHALAQTVRLEKAAASNEARVKLLCAGDFLNFYLGRALHHFREEEELFFPPVVSDEQTRELVIRAVLEHLKIHGLVAELKTQLSKGDVENGLMDELAQTLRLHVRFEEDILFPLIEQLVPPGRLESIATHRRDV